MKNYIIVTPPYGKSNGIRALHLLAEQLSERGYNVTLFSHRPLLDKYQYTTHISATMRRDDVVVYPEIITGNPLGFKNVVRWVLYYPGRLGGDAEYHHSEQVFTWDSSFYPNAPVLNLPFIDKKIFYKDDRPKKHDSYFVYKGGIGRSILEIRDAQRIDMSYPKTREELGELLRDTDTLYSYDAHSAILDEALVCGAKVKIITPTDLIDYTKSFEQLNADSEKKIERFINITQAMDYRGQIQKSNLSLLKRIRYAVKVYYGLLTSNSRKIYKYSLENTKKHST